MKRIYLLGLGIIGLMIVSCQKQEIVPVASDATVVPTWEKAMTEDEGTGNGTGTTTGHNGGGNGITDPNNDPDGNKK